jgi:peptidoglycan/xylan/chitin deacetylase (PgdA/CDA1 family)
LLQQKSPSGRRFLLSFDDGTLDHYEVILPLVARHNCTAIFFVPTSKLGRAGYLNEGQLREIDRLGQKIGLHGHEHQRMDTLCEEDIRVQFEISSRLIQNATGTKPLFFAPPGGYFNSRVRSIALESGVRAIRIMRWGFNRHLDTSALQCIPLNRYVTRKQFFQIAGFHNRAMLYTSKQIVKRLIPSAVYESLRRGLLKRLRRN